MLRPLALAIGLAASLPAAGVAQRRDTIPLSTTPGRRVTAPDTAAADTAPALGPRLPLATVIARTLAHSPAVAGAKGTVRDALAARRVAVGAYLPSLALTSIAGWSNQTLVTTTAGSSAAATQATTQQTIGGGVSAALDVFTGGRRSAQRSQAAAFTRAADAGLVLQRYATILVAKTGYLDVLRAHDLVRVAADQVAQAELGLANARNSRAAGTAMLADVLSAQLAVSTARQQQLAAQDTLRLSAAALGRVVGADGSVDAEPADTLAAAPLALGDSALLALAVASAPAVTTAEAQAGANAAAVRAAKTLYVPTITAGAGYDWANASRVPSGLRQGWIMTFGTTFPLFDGFLREQTVTQAEAAADSTRVTAADTRRFVRAEGVRLLGSLHVAEHDIALTTESVRLATENLRVFRLRYRAGIAMILDVLTAQTSLVQAELGLVTARFNYLSARASLEALLGRPL